MSLRPSDESALDALLASLLKGRPAPLSPEDGDKALQEHKLLAVAVHRATGIAALGSQSETDGWITFFERYFPEARNGVDDARLLFDEWRTKLVKTGAPGSRVAVTHGLAGTHWTTDREGLCINLESMWDDFEHAARDFIETMKTDDQRREVVLDRWRRQDLRIVPFGSVAGATAWEAAHSLSVVALPPDDPSK